MDSFCNGIFLPKAKGVELRQYSCVIVLTLKNIHANYGLTFGQYLCTSTQVFSLGQGSETELNHLGLNQPPFFPSDYHYYYLSVLRRDLHGEDYKRVLLTHRTSDGR